MSNAQIDPIHCRAGLYPHRELRIFIDLCVGDVGNYCPVKLRDEKWLLPGKPRLSLQVRQRVYMLFDEEKKYKFTADTRRYLPSLDKCNDANETGTLKVPPPR